ncbi:MAG: quinone-dependent dihydroorotate dehydrogenase [Planctomycetota bacterium]|nr:MAG: quinone-dependent dihydroorotate dehydrogenase [Planctomycetota bacterium]
MDFYTTVLRPFLFRCDAEWMHDQSIRIGSLLGRLKTACKTLSALYDFSDSRLTAEIIGIRFPNPVGLAAGFDKSGRSIEALAALGFGHLEIGSISADPSAGNPRPRLWRLPQDRAIIVNYGLPNDGAVVVAERLAKIKPTVPLGINIVKTNRGIDAPPESDDEIIDDYIRSVRTLKDCADYLSLNLSCPNTETGRDFFTDRQNTVRLMTALRELDIRCPVFLKVSPLGGIRAIEELLETVEGEDFVSGFIFNLPPGKPDNLKTPQNIHDTMTGAVSGKPVEQLINQCICEMYKRMDRKRYCIIGVGGIFTAQDAYLKIRMGASLVQLYTSIIFEGPAVVRKINEGLCRLLERDGFANIGQAVGTMFN